SDFHEESQSAQPCRAPESHAHGGGQKARLRARCNGNRSRRNHLRGKVARTQCADLPPVPECSGSCGSSSRRRLRKARRHHPKTAAPGVDLVGYAGVGRDVLWRTFWQHTGLPAAPGALKFGEHFVSEIRTTINSRRSVSMHRAIYELSRVSVATFSAPLTMAQTNQSKKIEATNLPD